MGRLAIALVISSGAAAGAVVAVNKVIDVKLATAKRVRVRTAVSTGGSVNFLVLGADSQALDTLSDTMWVVRVDPSSRHALVVSFPRDLWVQIPGHGLAKINASNNGGPQLVIDTLKADFGISINHYVQVDYSSFKGVVDAIGTVPVYVPYPARDDKAGFYSPTAGCKSFTGYDALQYVRSRTLSYYSASKDTWLPADAVPDIDRIARQQDFVRRLGNVAAAKSRTSLLTANRIADRVLQKLTVDADLSKNDVLSLIDTFYGINPSDPKHVQFATIPWLEGPSQQGQSVLYLHTPDVVPVIEALGGSGIGSNPSISVRAPAATPTSLTAAPGPPIANQGALGPPAPRHAPC